jgi:enterochelin esterase-like enzyme
VRRPPPAEREELRRSGEVHLVVGRNLGVAIVSLFLAACAEETPEPSPVPAPSATVESAEPLPEPVTFDVLEIGEIGDSVLPPRPITLFVPEVEAPDSGFPFLVVTDGDLAATHHFDVPRTLATLMRQGRVAPTVVVAVPSREDRDRELSTRARAFVTFVADVVLPAARARVPLRPSGAIFGYSFGGLAAVVGGAFRPEVFSRVIAMSPSLWFHRREVLRDVHAAPRLADRWWLDVGTEEGRRGETVPYMVADARQLRDDLARRGFTLGQDLGYREAPGRDHAMEEAGARMRDALGFALGEEGCTPLAITFYAFHPRLRVRERSATSIGLHCASGVKLTLPSARAEHEVSPAAGLWIAPDGVLEPRAPGRYRVLARHAGHEAAIELVVR